MQLIIENGWIAIDAMSNLHQGRLMSTTYRGSKVFSLLVGLPVDLVDVTI